MFSSLVACWCCRAARENYQKLLDGNVLRDLAPRPVKDENRLSGAHRRFAMQLLVSKKLDARDAAKAQGKAIVSVPDYKQRLEEQVRQKSQAQKKQQEKAARRQAAAGGTTAPQATSSSSAAATSNSSSSSASATPSRDGAVSLSKSLEQQRQSKQAKQVHQKTQAELKAEVKAAAAAADAAAAAEAAATAASAESDAPKVAAKIHFSTEMRPGESFRSYQARLVQEKSRLMNAEVTEGKKKLSERKKRKLDEKEQKRKERKGLGHGGGADGDDGPGEQETPIERRVRKEREAKDAADIARGDTPEGVPATKRQRLAEEAAGSGGIPSKRKEFSGREEVAFGEVAERPPTLTLLPKSKTLSAKVDAERMRAGLLLLQKQKKKKGQNLDEEEKAEWLQKQADLTRRTLAADEAKERELQSLREASIQAYKQGKRKRLDEAAETRKATAGSAASGLEGVGGTKGKDEVYVKKRTLKKQARNRDRMRQFKDNADLDLDMEIEMADDVD